MPIVSLPRWVWTIWREDGVEKGPRGGGRPSLYALLSGCHPQILHVSQVLPCEPELHIYATVQHYMASVRETRERSFQNTFKVSRSLSDVIERRQRSVGPIVELSVVSGLDGGAQILGANLGEEGMALGVGSGGT